MPDDEIKHLESVLTMVDGRIVYGTGTFAALAPPAPPVLPDWSPVHEYGGYHRPAADGAHACARSGRLHEMLHRILGQPTTARDRPIWDGGCACFAY